MTYENVRQIQDDIDDLISDSSKLVDSLCDESDVDINEWCKMHRVCEKMCFLEYQIKVVSNFICLIYDLENEKDRFEVQKTAQYHYKQLEKHLDVLLEICRIWGFKDYRCIDLIKRISGLIIEIKKYYENKNIF